jgi:hypothetical protein
MVCPGRFSLVAITDVLTGFLPGIEVVPTPIAAKAMDRFQTPEKASFPSCYRRLWMFSEEAKALGERVMLIDVDLVFTADPAPLFAVEHDFVGWRPMRTWGTETRIGGGIYLLRTGTRTKVWTGFKGQESITLARQAGLRGSDQAWMSYCLAKTEPTWPQRSGIYSVRDLTVGPQKVISGRRRPLVRLGRPLGLPDDAMIVQFNGPDKCWSPETRAKHPWLNNCYERSDNAKLSHG